MTNATVVSTSVGPIAYDEVGSGPAVLFIHAFPFAGELWAPQVAALSTQFRVVVPDLFGFGATALPDSGVWSIADGAAALAEVIDTLNLAPVVVVGLSMGGYIALSLVRLHPEKLRALVLADTRAEADSAEAKAGRDKAIAAVETGGAAAQVEAMLPKALGRTTHATRPGIVSEFRALGLAQTQDGVIAGLKALRDRPDAVAGLSTILVPTLVIVGEEDELTPPAAAQVLAKGIPNATLKMLPQAGHLSNLEVPDEFNAALLEFLHALPE